MIFGGYYVKHYFIYYRKDYKNGKKAFESTCKQEVLDVYNKNPKLYDGGLGESTQIVYCN